MKPDRKYTPKFIRSEMRRLMKCMDFCIKKTGNKLTVKNNIYYEIYQMLGSHAWQDLCDKCNHDMKKSKKFPWGRCKFCGKIGPNEN